MISMIILIYAMALEDSFELEDAASRREKHGKKKMEHAPSRLCIFD